MSINKMDNYPIFDSPTTVYKLNGFSLQELLSQFWKHINEVIEGTNLTREDMDNLIKETDKRLDAQDKILSEFIEWVKNEALPPLVEEEILKMYEDGRLEALINETLLQEINDKVDGLEKGLEEVSTNLAEQTDKVKINTRELKEGLGANVKTLGAIGDGGSHTIRNTFPSVTDAEVKAVNPNANLDSQANWYIIQKSLNENKNTFIPNGNYLIDLPLIISKGSTKLEFDDFAEIKGLNNPRCLIQLGTSTTPYQNDGVFNVKLINPRLRGTDKMGIGIEIRCCGEHSEILNPRITEFNQGIKTACFDCFQLNQIYEPLIVRNNIGIDDSLGGLQACRVFGGRIENNEEYGLISASPNTKYIGIVIEGNKKAEIKLVNTTNVQGSKVNSKLNLTSAYLEHSVFTSNEGFILLDGNFLGEINLINCDIYSHGDILIKHIGNTMTSFRSNMFGGNLSVKQLFFLPYATVDSVLNIQTSYQEGGQSLPPLTDVVGTPRVQYFYNGNYYNSGATQTQSIFGLGGVNTPANIVHTKKLYLQPLDREGSQYRLITCSTLPPWEDSGAGTLAGSIHINLTQLLGYMRKTTKVGDDIESNWAVVMNPFS